MADLIDRQMVIDAIHYEYDGCCNIDESGSAIANDIERIIDNVSSVQPEYPKGRWIPTASEKGRHECSRCHEYAPCYQDGSEHLSTFCVLCGAKMEEGK